MNVRQSVSLANYTSLHVGGPAATLIELGAEDDLLETLKQQEQPIWVLGSGTNCLISDQGLPGTVILNKYGNIEQLGDTTLRADSGISWDELVQKAIELNLYGLEFTSGIPGTVGAAVVGNIAAYGHSVANCLTEVTLLDTSNGSISVWVNDDFDFGYRTSNLQKSHNKNLVVINATFQLSKVATGNLEYDSAKRVGQEIGVSADSLKDRRKIILETRRRAGSLVDTNNNGPWTAGSFFKNPLVNEDQVQAILAYEEAGVSREQLLRQNKIHGGSNVRVSAAHVLLAAGFSRGQTWGHVRLHQDHILKVENAGDATAQEIYEVIQLILKTVRQRLGITLEPEVRFLGTF